MDMQKVKDDVQKVEAAEAGVVAWCKAHPRTSLMVLAFVVGVLVMAML